MRTESIFLSNTYNQIIYPGTWCTQANVKNYYWTTRSRPTVTKNPMLA